MLANSLAVTTLVVTDLDRARKFYAEQLGLRLLEENPFSCRFGAGKGSQLTVRRGQPPVSGPTVAHFEVDDIEAEIRDLTSRGVTFEDDETPRQSTSSPRSGRLAAPGSRTPTATCSAFARGRYRPTARRGRIG